jgi:RNase H-fold protein (predicted Holliday junction resolvase)
VTATIAPLMELAASWPARGALIGLDLGTKTIGVSVSDPDRKLATGVETVKRTAFTTDAARLIALDASRAKRAKVIDEHAAIFILQGALDRLATLNR